MGATEEQMQLLSDAGVTHVAYVLILYSVAFVLFLCKLITTFYLSTRRKCGANQRLVVNILLHVYAVHAFPESATTHADEMVPKLRRREDSSSSYTVVNDGFPNGSAMNGHPRSRAEAQQIQDAEAFELQGLISEEDEHENLSNHPRGKEIADDEESLALAK